MDLQTPFVKEFQDEKEYHYVSLSNSPENDPHAFKYGFEP